MLRLSFSASAVSSLLCLGAHSDDIEIGCAGLVARLLESFPRISVHWVVLTADGPRKKEALQSADALLADAADKRVIIGEFRNGFFPYHGAEIKEFFESLKQSVRPDLILTHYREDLHQDHRTVAELTWNTFRDNVILEYEIPKYDGGMGSPNYFVPLSTELVERKLAHLEAHFHSQHSKQWFSAETFRGLMRLRGLECNSASGYAEAYYARKVVW